MSGTLLASRDKIAGEHRVTRAKRYRQIARVLARHGLGSAVGLLSLGGFVPLRRRAPNHAGSAQGRANGSTQSSAQSSRRLIRIRRYSPPEHVRMALEELGATFIKLGQILSTRADLLPPEYLAELAKLQDAAPQVPFDTMRELLVAELGKPIEEAFSWFDPEPLAAASIGQAHAARLPDGTEVVVKIRRPGVVEQIETDLEILQDLAVAAGRRWQFASQYDLPGLAREFAQTLRSELDYMQEARNAERFAANFAGDPNVHIPRIFRETTTSKVLTLERIRGVKISDLDAFEQLGIDRKALAGRAAGIILKMVFDDGFFHADPHPGNFFIEPGGRIGLIDFGMVGRVERKTQEQLAEIVLAVTSRDADSLVDLSVELGIAHGAVNRNLLSQDMNHIMSRYYAMDLGDLKVGDVLNDTLEIVRRHHLQLPSNLALLIKTFIMNEGLGAQLDPSFNLAALLAPYARWLAIRYYSPFVWAKRLGQAGLDVAHLAAEMPQQVRHIISEVEHGGLQVSMRPEGFEQIVRRIERLANRIVLGIMAAAFINGLAVLLSVYRIPGWEQWIAILFAVGFVVAVALGVYLAWSILRSGRD